MEILAQRERTPPEERAAREYYSEVGVPTTLDVSSNINGQSERTYPEEDLGINNAIQHSNGIRDRRHDSLANGRRAASLIQLAPSGPDRHPQPTDDLFDMEIVVQPPSRVRPGRLLYPPVVLRVRQLEVLGLSSQPLNNSSVLWVLVSLVSADESTVLAPPDPGLIIGNPVDSIHPLIPALESRDLGFASFPNIAIRDPGEYRIRVSLIRMTLSDASGSAAQESGANLLNILSRIIRVEDNVRSPVIGKSRSSLLVTVLIGEQMKETGTASRRFSREVCAFLLEITYEALRSRLR